MSEPSWLNSEELEFWRAFIAATTTVMGNVEAELKADAGIGFDDYEVLVHLSEAEDRRLRMSDLSERLLHSRSRLSQRVDRMVQRGLVQREKCPEDGRGTFAVLTDEGFSVIEQAAPQHVAAVRSALIDRLSADQLRSGQKILDVLAL
jgi:DNA-binding MarR family transcriptional regulator